MGFAFTLRAQVSLSTAVFRRTEPVRWLLIAMEKPGLERVWA